MRHRSKLFGRAALGAGVALTLVAGLIAAAGPASAGPGPVNDLFAAATTVPGTSATVFGSNVGAGIEPGEPSPDCCVMNQTVWWRWTAPYTGTAIVDTVGSGMDTVLAVYAEFGGTSIDTLLLRDANDDGATNRESRVAIDVSEGNTYRIQVDGFSSTTGPITLRVNPRSFDDVSRTHPFWAEIEWIFARGIAEGYADGGYHPGANISRGAMSAFIYRLARATSTPPTTPTFRDVSTSHPFFTEVEWMNDEGITTGYPDDTYRPSASVSRQAMSAFLYRLSGDSWSTPTTARFTDVPLSHPFAREIDWMWTRGVSQGYDDDTYRPSATVSRAAMAAFLFRYDYFVE